VQVLDEFELRLFGLQDNEETDVAGARLTLVVAEVPL